MANLLKDASTHLQPVFNPSGQALQTSKDVEKSNEFKSLDNLWAEMILSLDNFEAELMEVNLKMEAEFAEQQRRLDALDARLAQMQKEKNKLKSTNGTSTDTNRTRLQLEASQPHSQ